MTTTQAYILVLILIICYKMRQKYGFPIKPNGQHDAIKCAKRVRLEDLKNIQKWVPPSKSKRTTRTLTFFSFPPLEVWHPLLHLNDDVER